MRVLFLNEGNLGTHIMGQGQLEDALRAGLEAAPDVEARFAALSPMTRATRAAADHRVPPLAALNLDLPTLRWHMVQSLRARSALRGELREWPADVVHVHTQAVALAMVATMRTMPVALSVDTTAQDWWAMPAWRPAQRLASTTIAPSRALERRALAHAAVVLAWTGWARRGVERTAPAARVVEHHPGLDLGRYHPARRRQRALPRILFVGGRFLQKGGEDLLAALEPDLGRELELDVVTPTEVLERPGVRVHRLNAADPALLDLQQQADIFCLPTHGDAAPWALLEAMACGTPIVATSIGGIPDLLDEGRAGVLVPHGDRAALRQALRALLADTPRRALLATCARRRCEEKYDARRQFALLTEHLQRARSGQGPARDQYAHVV